MKRIILFAVCLLSMSGSLLAQTSGKTFTKSFNAEGVSKIKFDLPGAVDLKIWNQPTVRIEIHVALPSGNVSTLEQLAKVGRYDLRGEISSNMLVISAPNLHRVVRIRGEEVKENVTYVVFMPRDVEAEIVDNTPAQAPPSAAIVQKKP